MALCLHRAIQRGVSANSALGVNAKECKLTPVARASASQAASGGHQLSVCSECLGVVFGTEPRMHILCVIDTLWTMHKGILFHTCFRRPSKPDDGAEEQSSDGQLEENDEEEI
ncbi:hypothetical protein EYF80_011771 [Liparis tanakae]|uniref:Uncharacterized protein n=1 Tax=Liparis tanakae TaxID=230148 RepID=A0A4Z2IJP7_9TELE|nr:hypothetical protein EYF80_011771 [Liparis tanakae]